MNLRLLMERQKLIKPSSADGFDEIFRNMSPVHTNFWTDPGSPPTINGRCDMDDKAHCYMLRSKREIVKGRFQGQSVGYVFADDKYSDDKGNHRYAFKKDCACAS